MEWSEGGGKWDNCNSIINKYIFKMSLKESTSKHTNLKSFELCLKNKAISAKNKIYSQMKKNNEILPFVTTWMDLEGLH